MKPAARGTVVIYDGSGIRYQEGYEAPAADEKITVEIIPDSAVGEPAAVLEIPACETDTEVTADLPKPMTGIHDLYFRFTESGTALLEWQFQQKKQ